MEGSTSSSTSAPCVPKCTPGVGGGGGASKYLSDLPSRGCFSSTVLSPNLGGMRVYVCDHNTSPQEDQLIQTNSTNILIRALMLKKQKGDSSLKKTRAEGETDGTKKRVAEKGLDSRASSKRPATNSQTSLRQEGAKTQVSDKECNSLTVEKLRTLLRERGLSTKGKKDELIARLKAASS